MEPGSLWSGEHDGNAPHFRHAVEIDDPEFWRRATRGEPIHGGWFQAHDEDRLRRDMACYYGMTSFMDREIGRILAALESSGQARDTLVIFTSDHGHFLGHHGLTAKAIHMYEDLVRVPFIARWPGKIVPGSNCREVICLNDFMATVAEILEFPPPDNATEDSTSILPLLTGDETFLPGRPMVVNHDYHGNFAIRDGKWKLVGEKLFNLDTDLKETTDVAAQHPEIAARMARTLETYRQSGRSRALRPPYHERALDR
jgi:arylsulfatase A-like enzyme